MKYLLRKEQTFILKAKNKVALRFLFKVIIANKHFSRVFRNFFSFLLQRYYKRFFFSRIVHRCIFSQTARSFHYFFKMSRHSLKYFVSYGFIYGVTRYGW